MEGKSTDQDTISGLTQRYRLEVLPKKTPKPQADRKWQLDHLNKVFGKVRLEAVTPPHIQYFLDKREKRIAGNREIILPGTLYRHAIRWGLCSLIPYEAAFLHPESGRDQFITDAEPAKLAKLAKLKAEADPKMPTIIGFAYLVGSLRQGILKQERKDITLEGGLHVRQGETNKRQLFSMAPELERVIKLAKHVNRKAKNLKHLFTNTRGQQITSTRIKIKPSAT